MTISQALIEQLQEQESVKANPNNRLKYLHLRKDIILEELQEVSLDGKTFNGKPYLTSRIRINDPEQEIAIRFDAVTVAYKQNQDGDLDFAFVLKSHKDEYVKSTGRKLADTILGVYTNNVNKTFGASYTHHYGYHAFVGTYPLQDILGDTVDVLPPGVTGKLTVSDIRNSLIVGKLKDVVYDLIKYTTDPSNPYFAWVYNIHIQGE